MNAWRADALVGTREMVRFALRRDRVRFPAWVAGIGVFLVYLVLAVPMAYGSDEELVSATALFADPVGRLLTGPAYGLEDPTLERFVASGYGLYLGVLVALMNILLVVRHTRLEEQSGRAELVRANVVGRDALLTSAILVALLTDLAVVLVGVFVLVVIGGFAVQGSLLFAVAIGVTGLVFAGIAAVTAQLTAYSRAAAGLAGVALGLSLVARAGGDMVAPGGSALSWVSPLGWGQQTAPFVLDRWWPLGISAAVFALTVAIAYQLSARRDFGASWFAVRPGPAGASPALGTPLGFAARLQRASIIAWASALAVSGLLFGAFADGIVGAMDDLPEVFEELFGEEDLLGGYLAYMAMFMSFGAACFAVLAIQGVRSEELRGRLEPVLATGLGRRGWLGSQVAVTAAATVLVLAVTGLGTGIGVVLVVGDSGYLGEVTLAHLVHLPSVLFAFGLAVMLFGFAPRAIGVPWILLGYGFFVGTFAELLQFPSVLIGLSPFSHVPQLPAEPFAWTPVLMLSGLAAITIIAGWAGFARRDIESR